MSLWGNIKGKVKKLGSLSQSRSSRVSSGSRDDMSGDSVRRLSRSQEEEEEAHASPAVPRPCLKIRVLMSVDQIVVRTDYEWDALELLKKQSYGHAKRFDKKFLMMTGLRQDMNYAFTAMGWSCFANINEPGSHLLTMEFLSTLHVETIGKETKTHFRFFNEFFEMLPRDFSNALGFSKKCLLEANALTDDLEYDRSAWWNEISDEPMSSKNSIVSIHNPTLRVLAKYLAMVVFS